MRKKRKSFGMPYGISMRETANLAVGAYKLAKGAHQVRKSINKSLAGPKATVVNNQGQRRKAQGKTQKRYYKKKPKNKVSALSKDVSELKKKVNRALSQFTVRVMGADRVLSALNQQTFQEIDDVSITTIESVLSNGRFYNPSVPGTLITASLAAGTYATTCRIMSQYAKCTFVNNYQVPCNIKVFAFVPRMDTNITPATAYTSGLADNAGGALTSTDPNVYMSDSSQLKEVWKVDKSGKCLLQPGEEFIFTYKTGGFNYDPALTDSHNSAYQPLLKAYSIYARVQGIIGHDSSLDEQAILASGVDVLVERLWRVEYDSGGLDLKYVVPSNTLSTITNSAVVSSKPIVDNISYSVA